MHFSPEETEQRIFQNRSADSAKASIPRPTSSQICLHATRSLVLWSTSRNELWEKGKTSGETFDVLEIRVNCEQNSLLMIVRPRRGGICHTKNRAGEPRNCYYRRLNLDTGKLENLDP